MPVNNITFLNDKVVCKVDSHSGKQRYDTSIVFCVDDSYLAYSLFAIKQILNIETDRKFDICVCLPDISAVPNYFRKLSIRFIQMGVSGVGDLPVDYLSLAAYNRIFLPHIFANEYKKIIYLDADIYVCKPFVNDLLDTLQDTSFHYCVAAAPDITEVDRHISLKKGISSSIHQYLKVYHKANHTYRNSGVLVFDVLSCVEKNFAERVLNKAFDPNSDLRCHDQSAINLAFKGEIPIIPFEFNWQLIESNYRLISLRKPYLIHFIGHNKPWKSDFIYTKPYIQEYKIFLFEYFPQQIVTLQNIKQIRLAKPKYESKFRECVSIMSFKLKTSIIGVAYKNLKYLLARNKRVIKAINAVNNLKS